MKGNYKPYPALGAASCLSLVFALAAGAGSFTIGPDYKRPTNSVPAQYKAESMGDWKQGRPLDDLPRGTWWTIYNDDTLNELQRLAAEANQDLKAAVARVDQSRAVARVARSELMPTINTDPSFNRRRYSPNQNPSFGNIIAANTFSTPLDLSYEIDLWGKVRRGFESARADAQATLAMFYNVLLTLHADVAQSYFALRALDAEIFTVTATVELRRQQVQLVRSRFETGIGNQLDLARAENQLANAEAETALIARRRAEVENSLAILTGQNPSTFRLISISSSDSARWNPKPPAIPAGLPSELLERRPDVAQAERQLASANARIGVAKASFFPVLRLTGSGGFLSGEVDNLFNWDSRVWSIGPSLSLPIFAGGRNLAGYRRSKSGYEEKLASYRQQILVAFADVENSLSGIRHLGEEAAAQDRAVATARRALELAEERYRAGLVNFLDVVDANREALQADRAKARLTGERLIATVRLVKALGGGWSEHQIFARTTRSP